MPKKNLKILRLIIFFLADGNHIIDEAPLGFFISQIHMVLYWIGYVLLVIEKNDTVSFCFDKLLISVEMTPEPVKHILPLRIEHMSSTKMEQTPGVVTSDKSTRHALFLI